VQGDLRPDLTFLLDVPVEVGLERAGRRAALDRIEKEGLAFHERVRAAYLDIARREPQRVRVIDASRSLDRIRQDLAVALEALLGRAP
jgi:dTMP kinase